jgi:hypothetical protein
MKSWRMLAQYDAETTTYSESVGAPASPYTPDFSAKLIGLRVIVNRQAATTLTNHVQFKLTCNTFRPNSIECGAQGSGLQTAPAQPGEHLDWNIEQTVTAGVPITIEARCIGDTQITNSVLLYGLFEAS